MSVIDKQAVKTAFFDYHVAAGAKMVEFAGFMMPIQYKGSIAEHQAVRENIGLFDLSHMGEVEVSGPGALDYLQRVTTNDVAALEVGRIQYSCMTKEDGGIVDDLLVYRLPDRYMLVINAACHDKDLSWLESQLSGNVALVDRSPETSLLAVQGPNAESLLAELTDFNLADMRYYSSATANIAGCEIMFSRTGYTGEDGFELYIPPQHTEVLWKAVTEAGKSRQLELIGLAARDSLRLEMKMALYGNDIDESTNPIEAGLGWVVDLDKEFIGRELIARVKEEKPKRRLICLELEGRVIPRHGFELQAEGKTVGQVTSGTFSPSLQKPIALGYLPRRLAKVGTTVDVVVRDKLFAARVVKPPFYKGGSHR